MAILTGPEILNQIGAGNIIIDPLKLSSVGPNSVDLHLGGAPLRVYDLAHPLSLQGEGFLDPTIINATTELPPQRDEGGNEYWILFPRKLYLGCTAEYTETHGFVPYLDGRSSLGRLGVFAHVTAGRGDVGFRGRWTVEIVVTHPTKLYVGGRYFQITYHTIEGVPQAYSGQYQGDLAPMSPKKTLI